MIRCILGACALLAVAACAQATSSNPADTPNAFAVVERGKYLVESIGLCADCHTQRLPTGMLDKTRDLHGATLVFAPMHPQPWAPTTPALAGLPTGYTEAQFVSFLQTGARPDGSQPLPPMPPNRFNEEDAKAMTAYLKSLPKPPAK
ncbi:MAG: c-type cytochrome [Alphaproteobacteria bacterium]|nr:c-type cytochrome [Alphaproteobacteria bacterium]